MPRASQTSPAPTLSDRLRASTEAMANIANVPMALWNEHSNLCLEAADALDARVPELLAVLTECAAGFMIKSADQDNIDYEGIARELHRRMTMARAAVVAADPDRPTRVSDAACV